MNTDYSKWSKFDVEEEDAAPQGIGAPPSMAFEDLDRVVCREHNVYHNLSDECPKCRSARMRRPADDDAALSSPRGSGGDGGGVEPSESAPPPVPSESEVAASALKVRGNAALAAGDYTEAAERYLEALAVLDKESEVVVEDEGSGFDISDGPAEA
eukprot:CAMPEP_0119466190 /NCGR_PEP_ID=MMETSP1344-20130328/964_1 /TAXON_ID=236787 /ORGANISM="Florenciella parvula, Strain CCMP2471" /LENGTH=155 /DNA_ID=CAMNT_0007498487 /DNA_START=10 /DNA_END=474 /DNA_ORIENTATION=+